MQARLYVRAGLLGAAMLLAGGLPVDAQGTEPGPDTGIEFLLGGEQWQPGQRFRAGADWLALVCVRAECSFEPARLAVRREQWQGHYDDKPTNGQKLTFSRQTSGPGKVLAWFRLNPRAPWITPGPVTTYAASTARIKRPASEGTLELAIDLPDGTQAALVPLYDREGKRFLIQLRVPGRRQLLDEIGSCSHTVSTEYLVWAGDLDRDGKPDYLIVFADEVGGVREVGEAKLYLGKEAGPGEIVGVAGVYVPPPYGGECDGSGWLE